MKAKAAARMRQEVREAVRAALESEKNAVGFHVLTISFENRSLSIPYQPWAPRKDITVPGRWLQDGD